MTLSEWINHSTHQLETAGVSFGHGTDNAYDEAVWLSLWCLGLPLDTDLLSGGITSQVLSGTQLGKLEDLLNRRITSRRPAAYLTGEAWLQGLPFFVDERVIIPRSLIAELVVNGAIDPWLTENTKKVLDLCTGNGSLAVIAAVTFPEVTVWASDLSQDALDVARINIGKHALESRIELVYSDGLGAQTLADRGPFDLILCNPPYVNAQSMAELPAEFKAEPTIALDGNFKGGQDGMDFIRQLLRDVVAHLSPHGILVLEIGHERVHFEAAFSRLETIWLETSAASDQVVLLTYDALKLIHSDNS